eukprot:UN07786
MISFHRLKIEKYENNVVKQYYRGIIHYIYLFVCIRDGILYICVNLSS